MCEGAWHFEARISPGCAGWRLVGEKTGTLSFVVLLSSERLSHKSKLFVQPVFETCIIFVHIYAKLYFRLCTLFCFSPRHVYRLFHKTPKARSSMPSDHLCAISEWTEVVRKIHPWCAFVPQSTVVTEPKWWACENVSWCHDSINVKKLWYGLCDDPVIVLNKFMTKWRLRLVHNSFVFSFKTCYLQRCC